MKTRWSPRLFLLLFAATLGVASCGTRTTLDSSWHVPEATSRSFSKIVVIGLLDSPVKSKAFESAVVDRFQAAGVSAVPGFSVVKEDTDTSRKEMERKVKASGADAVLIFKQIAMDETQQYVAPTDYVVPEDQDEWWDDAYWGYYHPYPYDYWGYWYPAAQVVASPGYWEQETTYRVEACLYRVSDGKLVWVGDSSTYDPRGNTDLASSISKVVIENLREARLVAPKPA